MCIINIVYVVGIKNVSGVIEEAQNRLIIKQFYIEGRILPLHKVTPVYKGDHLHQGSQFIRRFLPL